MSRAWRLRRRHNINDEKGEEQKDPDQKLRREEVEEGKRSVEEPLTLKVSQLPHPQRLSDSENEEPFQGRMPRRSAFVSKGNFNSLTSLTWNIHSKIERSQSCSDTVNETGTPSRRRAPRSQKPKAAVGGCTSMSIVGVLLSTENSRSFSAPVLTSEKRVAVNSLTAFTPLQKPERSISPESNDSISEELNHFKPIVCSPCTPPKRLPNGKVLSPVIIKSTPRNLRKSLQKPTTYEASPLILKKWEEVFQERRMNRTVSKGTLTSSAEGYDDTPTQYHTVSSNKESSVKSRLNSKEDMALGDPELLPCSSKEVVMQTKLDKKPALPGSEFLLGPSRISEDSGAKELLLSGATVSMAARLSSKLKAISKCKCLGAASMKPGLKRAHKNNSQPNNLQNGTCFTATENISPEFPVRRGQKRRCKTKHLEQNGSLKRLKVACGGDSCKQGFERLWREAEQRLHQEEEDKKLALKLQQIFDKESRTVNRCKGSRDEYPLRSKSTAGAN